MKSFSVSLTGNKFFPFYFANLILIAYAGIPVFGKWFLSFLMLLGRLEPFTVLIILTPSFWKR
ncbi:MAG: hypothetical protein K9H13_04600 [Bacteroidales bacterium]|nr:hypothetical protein [Bacteroidales bacterium]